VVLDGGFAVGLLEVVLRGGLGHPEDLVVLGVVTLLRRAPEHLAAAVGEQGGLLAGVVEPSPPPPLLRVERSWGGGGQSWWRSEWGERESGFASPKRVAFVDDTKYVNAVADA
jgi:hypothetical protein